MLRCEPGTKHRPVSVILGIRNQASRIGVRILLDTSPAIDVTATADTSTTLVHEWCATRPDVIVADCGLRESLPDLLADLARCTRRDALAPIVLLAPDGITDDELLAAVAAGVSGIVLRDDPVEDVVQAIVTTHHGDTWVNASIGGRLLALIRERPSWPVAGVTRDGVVLTEREWEVLERIAEGMSNSEIAEKLVVTVRTVKHHVSNVLSKLGARDRAHAIALVSRPALQLRGR